MKGQRVQLHRALSKKGICSRSQAMPLIRKGSVSVNGRVISDPLAWVNVENDRIDVAVKDQKTDGHAEKIYLAMNKPTGYVTTASDEMGRKTVYDLLPEEYRKCWLFPVGRLDKESRGLLLFTNDGPWADRMTSPSSECEKTYVVETDVEPTDESLQEIQKGLLMDGRKTLPASLSRIGNRKFEIRIKEGRNRQVRRMFGMTGCTVKDLVRVSIGKIVLGELSEGSIRKLSEDELEYV